MCLTDATMLICHDPKDKKRKAVLASLKKKMEARKKYLQGRIDDIDRGLKVIEQQAQKS